MPRLLCGGSQLGCDLGIALSLTVLQILTHLRQTGTGGDQLTDDDVLLQTGQRVDLALVTDALVLTAVALPVLGRSKNALAVQRCV